MNPVNDLQNSLPFRCLSITLACLSLMAVAGCSTNGATYSLQLSPTDDAREALIKAERAGRAVKSFRLRMEWHHGATHLTLCVLEVASSDRSRRIEGASERVIIGEDFYEREFNGPWKKLPGKNERMASDFTQFPEPFDAKNNNMYKDVKFIGQEILDNVPVLVYQYTQHSGDRLYSTNKIWIGAQDGLARRSEAEIETEFNGPLGGSDKVKEICTMSDFNAKIVIERPLVPPTLQATETGAEAIPGNIDEKQRQVVQQAAEAWLKLMDEGKTSEGREAAAQGLKAEANKASWEKLQHDFAERAKARGTVKSRKLQMALFVKSLPSVLGQEGIVLVYTSTFEKDGSVIERVELAFEQDQVWRVAMYSITTGSDAISFVYAVPSTSESYAGREPRGGIGVGKGGGIGSGDGAGLGPGTGFNTGGGNPRPNPNTPATSVDQKPVALNNPAPQYTDAARQNKTQGTVRLRVLVGTDGSVKQVRMVRGLPDGLEDEAIRAAYKMRYQPAMKGGQPVAFWLSLDIAFYLR